MHENARNIILMKVLPTLKHHIPTLYNSFTLNVKHVGVKNGWNL